jgi:hypothetical protein
MRFLGLSRASWVTVVIVAVWISLSSGTGDFFRRLPLNLLIAAVVYILLTALGRLLMRLLPESRFKRFIREWL